MIIEAFHILHAIQIGVHDGIHKHNVMCDARYSTEKSREKSYMYMY